ncbi:hypothetical protein [Actinacidiphila glaucinigra]|uniref:hypothetical protein n=1 Tax=Actinacidiphila glaucinigra TaxID=235986 RepID=UPI00366D9A42
MPARELELPLFSEDSVKETPADAPAVPESPRPAHMRPVVAAGPARSGASEAHEVWCAVPPDAARRRFLERAAARHPVHTEGARFRTEMAEPLGLGSVHRVDATRPVDVGQLALRIAGGPFPAL